MLGLPTTTRVGCRLPKEAFYKNLKLTPKQKDAFVHGVERIDILNSIKEGIVHIPAGDTVKEIMIVGLMLRDESAATTVVDEIAKANSHKLVFLCEEPGECATLAVRVQSVRFGPRRKVDELSLALEGNDLDAVWDCVVSQVVFGDAGMTGTSVVERIALVDKIGSLERLVDELDDKCRKAKQVGKKNELFAQMRAAEDKLEQTRKELE
ncbi:DUF4391 domain-containing protein [Eggerthella sinensis]|uniref:DUF4391 domain-containing protein n=1 Tax=Eggerthella sinensis TaxID=242230 RepID=A0A3N0IZR1_9ACTN|nr:DUF4391 domain-containing protein [Eggerthella sinensis]RDB69447.1 hypothetical protein C1876_06665 [Eggerthella sinensis]RNM41920.1 hypothetical protein DMP09_07335 [Eggerthella sinensis]